MSDETTSVWADIWAGVMRAAEYASVPFGWVAGLVETFPKISLAVMIALALAAVL